MCFSFLIFYLLAVSAADEVRYFSAIVVVMYSFDVLLFATNFYTYSVERDLR